MPDIRIISDLHLAHPASTVGRIDALFPLLDGMPRVILNGDTMETCTEALAARSRELYDRLVERLASAGTAVDVLRGNHDPNLPGPAALLLDAGDVLVTHGDACFRFGSPWSHWFPMVRDKLLAVEQRYGGCDAVDTLDMRLALARDYAEAYYPRQRSFTGFLGKLETIAHAAWPPTAPLTILKIWWRGPDMVARWLEKFAPGAKIIIMGHTHRPGLWCRRERWIVNTGAFHPMGRPRVIDCTPGLLEIRPVVKKGGHFHAGRVIQTLRRRDGGWWLDR